MSKRSRDPLDDPRGGPKIRGLNYVGEQPAFLRNALAALSGQSGTAPGTGGRPAIPTRSEGHDEESDEEQDEWDLGRGDEAPAVVVLKEGKHLDRDEVDRLRADGAS